MSSTGYADNTNEVPEPNNNAKPKRKINEVKFSNEEIAKLIVLKKKWTPEKLSIENGRSAKLSQKQLNFLKYQKWRYEQGLLTEYMEKKYDNH